VDEDAAVVRVFVVDDHELLRRGLRDLFEADGRVAVVGEAATGVEALATLDGAGVDVALLDVRLPDADGVDVCRELRSRHPSLPCLMLTSYDVDEAMFAAAAAGAAGFLVKDIPGPQLVDAVRRVAGGEVLLDSEVATAVLDRLNESLREHRLLEQLSEQERRVFDLVAEGHTNREIAERLYLAEKTVRNYVSNVLAKLTLRRRAEMAAFAARVVSDRRREPGSG
jgi:two-component system, NarL family, response regulator DevR